MDKDIWNFAVKLADGRQGHEDLAKALQAAYDDYVRDVETGIYKA